MIDNGTIKLRIPNLYEDNLEWEQVETENRGRRCWLTQTSLEIEQTAIGQAAVGMYRCRVVLDCEVRNGWFLDGKNDWEDEYATFKITRVVNNRLHTDLFLKRVK